MTPTSLYCSFSKSSLRKGVLGILKKERVTFPLLKKTISLTFEPKNTLSTSDDMECYFILNLIGASN